jgi:uncharacterized coiled-coil protein SlyX
VIAAAALAIVTVFGIASWRYYQGDSSASPPKTAKERSALARESDLLELQASQQQLIDDIQLLQGRIASQQYDIQRLSEELKAATEALSSLRNAFAKDGPASHRADPPPAKKRTP